MIKAKRLLATILCVLMLMSAFTTMAFAAEKYFATDYVCVPKDSSTPAIKNTAVMFCRDVYGIDPKVQKYISVEWDGEEYLFEVGKNIFADFEQARAAAAELTDGIPQVLIAKGMYERVDFGGSAQVYGYDWNENPNVKNPSNPLADWSFNPAFADGNNTEIKDVVILGSATGASLTFYGIEISHRFYDIYRAKSNNKTVITLKNCILNQKSEYKNDAVIHNSPVTGRGEDRANQFAFSFWNGNSHSNVDSKDETHLINFRVQKVDMKIPAGSSYTNIFMDEIASPIFVMDGICVDPSSNLRSLGWFKVTDKVKHSHLTIKNSYLTKACTGDEFDIQTRTGGTTPDGVNLTTIVEFSGNIIKDASIKIYQTRTSAIDFNNNIFVNRANPFTFGTDASATDLSNLVSLKNNVFLGVSSFEYTEGEANSKVDMTGSFISPSTDSNYKALTSSIAPTGKIKYDYYYLDGAQTIKSSAIQPFTVSGATKDDDALTISATVSSEQYKYSPVVTGESFSYKIYKSDAEFSNLNSYTEDEKVEQLALKDTNNYFVFVAYSADGSVGVPYKFTVTRQGPAFPFVLNGQNCNSRDVYLTSDEDVFVLEPAPSSSYSVKLLDAELNELNSSTVVFGYKGQTKEFVYELTDGNSKDYYTVHVTRNFSKACEIISVSGLTQNATGYEVIVPKGTKSYTFGIEVSPDAIVSAYKGTEAYFAVDGKITINNLKEGNYTIGVLAQDGVTSTTVPLTVKFSKSNVAEVVAIKGATKTATGFVAYGRGEFDIVATVSEGATYAAYIDADCTYPLNYKPVITGDCSYWIKVVAEDGVTNKIVRLDLKRDNSGIIVDGIVNDSGYVFLDVGADKTTHTLNIVAKNCTYKLYADAKKKAAATNTVKLEAISTLVFAEVTYVDGTTEIVTINVYSEKSPVAYADNALIPGWAKKYIDALNQNGFGIFKGDENGNFNADSGMTRYEVAAIAVRLLGVDASQYANAELKFADSIEPWALNYVKAASTLGILSGTYDASGRLVFDGNSTTTREQLAKIMVDILLYYSDENANAVQIYYNNQAEADLTFEKLGFVDEINISDWAIPYVKLSVVTGIFEGSVESDGKRYFNAQQNIKRQEMAVIAAKYYGGEE